MKIKTKVWIFSLALVVASGGLIIGLTWNAVRAIVRESLINSGLGYATDLAQENTLGFKSDSENLLLPALQTVQQASHADFIAAIDSKGRVIAHTNVAERGLVYGDPLMLRMLSANQAGVVFVKRGKERFLEAWAPVWEMHVDDSNEEFLLGGVQPRAAQRLGVIRISLPTQEALRTQKRIIKEMSSIVVGIGFLALLFTLGLLRSLLKPIQLLSDGATRIAQGQYAVAVPVASKDELGELAGTFNHMASVLSSTTVSKNFLGDILSHMIDPLIVLAADKKIRMVNQAALDLLGYTREELEGQPNDILFTGAEGVARESEHEARIGKGSVRNLEISFVTKAGVKVPVLFSSSILKDADGSPTGVIAVAKDMTERKKLEGAIRQSEKMSAVGQLAAGVAHEINNPLGVILGFAQAVVRRLQPDDPLSLPLRSIEKEAVRCKNLVQDLLTFSRVSKIDREPLDMNRAVESALSLINAQARMSHVEVLKELAPDLPRILGNLNQIQQVIINLANNALDAIGQNGKITLKTECIKEGPLSWVRLTITDSGSGIPVEIQSRIFDPFFTTKAVGKGTGLGLSLVHEIIQKHSGTIDVQSGPGRTEFCIRFPVSRMNRALSATTQAPASA